MPTTKSVRTKRLTKCNTKQAVQIAGKRFKSRTDYVKFITRTFGPNVTNQQLCQFLNVANVTMHPSGAGRVRNSVIKARSIGR